MLTPPLRGPRTKVQRPPPDGRRIAPSTGHRSVDGAGFRCVYAAGGKFCPMDFDLPDEHRMIRDTVREFCEEEIEPIAWDIEEEHRFPEEVFDELADLDMMGVPISEEY